MGNGDGVLVMRVERSRVKEKGEEGNQKSGKGIISYSYYYPLYPYLPFPSYLGLRSDPSYSFPD
jgi:hypothetical protein